MAAAMRKGWWIAIGLAAALLAGCGGGSGDGGNGSQPAPDPGTLGTAGGNVSGPDGSRVEVPADALALDTRIQIAKDATTAPAVPADSGFRLVSNVFSITPHGQAFAAPVRVTLPLDTSVVGNDGQLVLLKAQPGGDWKVHTNVTRDGAFATAEVRDFSVFALALRQSEPFSFTVAASGTAPNLRVTYRFSGTRPTCRYGVEIQTRLQVHYYSYWRSTSTNVLGWTESVTTVTADEMRSQVDLAVPDGYTGAEQGHDVLQPMLPPDVVTLDGGSRYTQYVNAQVICRGEVFDLGINTPTPFTWTYRAANAVQIPSHVGPIALIEDIAPIDAVVGARALSSAKVQLRGDWRSSLVARSQWMLSRDGGTSWSMLAPADGVDVVSGSPLHVFRLGTTLPDMPASYDGALARLRTCIDPSLGTPACVDGASRPVRVSATAVAPAFSRQPASTVALSGGAVTFLAAVSGTPTPTLQWQRWQAGSDWTDIAGEHDAQLDLASVGPGDDGARFRLVAGNGGGTATSAVAALSVVDQASAPVVGPVSGDLAVARGGTAVFAATVSGTAPLSYQWYRDDTPLTGANTPILRLDNVTDGMAGVYVLEVSNPGGGSRGAAQRLAVTSGAPADVAPSIVTQPAAVAVGEGHTATFAVGVAGSGPLTFQWRHNGTPIAGATAAAYTIAAVAAADAGDYSVVVGNGAGSVTSQAASLAIVPGGTPTAPTIVTPPSSVVVAPGMSAAFGVTVQGSGPLTYRWFRNDVEVPGQTAAVYAIAAASALDAGSYRVEVSNAAGTAVSPTSQLILLGAPVLVTQPVAASVPEGEKATLFIAATGDALRFQWTRNGVAIDGATGFIYTTPALTLADGGAVYAVVVYNGAGAVVSAGAVLTVTPVATPGLAILAGDFVAGGGGGTSEGTGTAARFDFPEGLTADAGGHLYVATSNGGWVMKIDAAAAVTRLTLHPGTGNVALSPGTGDLWSATVGICGLSRISPPLAAGTTVTSMSVVGCLGNTTRGVAVDSNGAVYLASPDANSILRVTLAPQPGVMTAELFAGAPDRFVAPGSQDGTGAEARFSGPSGMAFGPDGNLYVADSENHTIRRITPQGVASTFAGSAGNYGQSDAAGTQARFFRPTDLAFDAAGNLIVLQRGDPANPYAHVRRVTPAGMVSTLFDATAESLALALSGQEPFARQIRGVAVLPDGRIALAAGNAILVRTLP